MYEYIILVNVSFLFMIFDFQTLSLTLILFDLRILGLINVVRLGIIIYGTIFILVKIHRFLAPHIWHYFTCTRIRLKKCRISTNVHWTQHFISNSKMFGAKKTFSIKWIQCFIKNLKFSTRIFREEQIWQRKISKFTLWRNFSGKKFEILVSFRWHIHYGSFNFHPMLCSSFW